MLKAFFAKLMKFFGLGKKSIDRTHSLRLGAEPIIPGLTAKAIEEHLQEKYDFKFRRTNDKDLYTTKGRAIYPGSEVMLRCCIYEEAFTGITSIEFKTDGESPECTLSNDDYYNLVEDFLGFCAELSYRDAQPLEARMWVMQNARNVTPDSRAFATFGKVQYALWGSELNQTLTLYQNPA